MKLEVGKYYRTRVGQKVGPMRVNDTGYYVDTHPFADEGTRSYKTNGRYLISNNIDSCDIIAEWHDEPVSPVRTVTRKEIVPGTYGKVRVTGGMYIHVNSMSTATELRAAIATLTKIAEALEESEQ